MAGKQGGLGDRFAVDGIDLSGDVNTITTGAPLATQDVTGMNQKGMARIGLNRDGSLTWNTFFNVDPGAAHETLKTLPYGNRIVCYYNTDTLGAPAVGQVSKQVDYNPTRAQDASITLAVSALASGYGQEWGRQHTAGPRADTTATNGTGVGALSGLASAFGLQAYLQVYAFTGTSCTVKLQESSDNGVGDAWADVVGGAFAAATAIGAQRIETARTLAVERYLRVVTTGTFTACTFDVVVVRNDIRTDFTAA